MSAVLESCPDNETRWQALRRQIEQIGELLIDQGTVVPKRRGGRTYWRLRYYETVAGKKRQRTLYIGTEENARCVDSLLDELRAPSRYYRETLMLAELAGRVARPLVRSRRRAGR